MAHALKDAGCKEAWIGAESGSQRILDAMNKGTTVAEILTARARLQAVGIRVGFFIQLGYLGEELVDVLATRKLLDNARPDDVGVSVSYPLPGTTFHALVKEQLRGKTHWQESDDLEMMFQGTYTSDFYRAVRDLLHEQVASRPTHARARRPRVRERAAPAGVAFGGRAVAHEHGYRCVLGPAAAADERRRGCSPPPRIVQEALRATTRATRPRTRLPDQHHSVLVQVRWRAAPAAAAVPVASGPCWPRSLRWRGCAGMARLCRGSRSADGRAAPAYRGPGGSTSMNRPARQASRWSR